MKKFIALSVSACIAFSLCACGMKAEAAANTMDADAEIQSNYEAELTANPVLDFPNGTAYTQRDENGSYINLPEAGRAENGNIIYDGDIAKITVLRCRYQTETPQYEIDLLIQNRTEKPVSIDAGPQAVVDGFAFDSFLFTDCEANALREATLYIFAEDFFKAGIETPREIKFNLSFFELDSNEYIDTVYEAIYPNEHEQTPFRFRAMEDIGFPELEYYNTQGGCNFRIIDAKFTENAEFYRIDMVLENVSNEHRVVSWKNVNVNGEGTDPFWYVGIPAGAKMLSCVFLDMDDLRKKGVDEPDVIRFDYTVDTAFETLLQETISFRPAKG